MAHHDSVGQGYERTGMGVSGSREPVFHGVGAVRWQGDPTHAGRPQATYRGGLVAPPLPKPRFVLTDTSGAPFDSGTELRGRSRSCFSAIPIVPMRVPST